MVFTVGLLAGKEPCDCAAFDKQAERSPHRMKLSEAKATGRGGEKRSRYSSFPPPSDKFDISGGEMPPCDLYGGKCRTLNASCVWQHVSNVSLCITKDEGTFFGD